MLFPIANIEVSPFIPPLVSFIISFFASMGGISGAFLLLPFQMSVLGYVNPSVSATNQVFNIVAIPSGVYRYWKEGRLIWALATIVILGTLPGVIVGGFIRLNYLPDAKNFKLFAAVVLFYIGLKLFNDLMKKNTKKATQDNSHNTNICRIESFNLRNIKISYQDEIYNIPIFGTFILSLLVGIVGGIYGIGGGAIIAPFFITFFKLPIHIVAGATLLGTFVTSVVGVIFFQLIAPYYPEMSVMPDWYLGLLFGLGGMVGMYCGAYCQKFMPANFIKSLLALAMFFISCRYVYEFLQ